MNKDFSTSRNPVVAFLNKAPEEFTAADIIRYVRENSIGMLNFMYPAVTAVENSSVCNQLGGISHGNSYFGRKG